MLVVIPPVKLGVCSRAGVCQRDEERFAQDALHVEVEGILKSLVCPVKKGSEWPNTCSMTRSDIIERILKSHYCMTCNPVVFIWLVGQESDRDIESMIHRDDVSSFAAEAPEDAGSCDE